jgi:L-cystine uptake protein TcyP (sodium:dicarboxylate symporter family)
MFNVFIIFTNEKNTTIYDNTILKFFLGFSEKKKKRVSDRKQNIIETINEI